MDNSMMKKIKCGVLAQAEDGSEGYVMALGDMVAQAGDVMAQT